MVVGVVLGLVLASVKVPGAAGTDLGTAGFKWIKSPIKWAKNLNRVSSPQSTQLYDETQVSKFMELRHRIDDEFEEGMNLVDAPQAQFNPWYLSMELIGRIDRQFDDFVTELDIHGSLGTEWAEDTPYFDATSWLEPQFHVVDTEDNMLVTCFMPEVDKGDVSIDLHGRQVKISAKSNQQHTTTTNGDAHQEATFARVFVVPIGVKKEDVLAKLDGDNLVVTVTKPRAVEQPREPIAIHVQGGEE